MTTILNNIEKLQHSGPTKQGSLLPEPCIQFQFQFHAEQHWEIIAALWSKPKYPILNHDSVFFYVSFAQRLAYGKILKTFFVSPIWEELTVNVVQQGDLLFLTEIYTRIGTNAKYISKYTV